MLNSGSWEVPSWNHRFSLLSHLQTQGLEVCTGVYGGPVEVEFRLHDAKPAEDDSGEWEDIAEASIALTPGPVTLGSDTDRPVQLGSIDQSEPSQFRVRIHASGRDAAWDEMVESVTERYLILCWPESIRPAEVVKSGSQSNLVDTSSLRTADANGPQAVNFSITGD